MRQCAHEVALSQGYPNISSGKTIQIGSPSHNNQRLVWHSRFTKRSDETGPAVYIGWDYLRERWSIIYDD